PTLRAPPPSPRRPTRLAPHDLGHRTPRPVARRASARTTSVISPLASSPDAPRLARPRSSHRSPRRPTRLGSHDLGHLTARLVARRASARTTSVISPLASSPDAPPLPLPRSFPPP